MLVELQAKFSCLKGWYTCLLYTSYEDVVESIAGEYAYLRRTDIYDNGEPMMIAMALLPDGVDVGTRLRWENLVYSVLE